MAVVRGAGMRTARARTAAVVAAPRLRRMRPPGRPGRERGRHPARLSRGEAAGDGGDPLRNRAALRGGRRDLWARDGVRGGLVRRLLEEAVAVHWAGDSFALEFRVPAAPWITAAAPMPCARAMSPSTCGACCARFPRGSATSPAGIAFRLTGPVPPSAPPQAPPSP